MFAARFLLATSADFHFHRLRMRNNWMGLIDAGPLARIDRYVGYYEPYAQSHEALDRDTAMQREVQNVARAVSESRAGRLAVPDAELKNPRPK